MVVVGSSKYILVADIGATHCRLGIVDESYSIVHQMEVRTQTLNDFPAVINDYLEEVAHKDLRVEVGVFGAAGLVSNGHVQLTQAPLSFSVQELLDKTALIEVHIINDAQAAGFSLGDRGLGAGMYLLVTVGTGLGVTPVIISEGINALASEAGHAHKPVHDRMFHDWLDEKKADLEWNDVLSGKGFEQIHEFLTGTYVRAEEITDEETIDFFSKHIQSFLRDMAVTFLPKKVFLAGGIVHYRADVLKQKIKPITDERFSEPIPVEVLDNDSLGMIGCAIYLRKITKPRQ